MNDNKYFSKEDIEKIKKDPTKEELFFRPSMYKKDLKNKKKDRKNF